MTPNQSVLFFISLDLLTVEVPKLNAKILKLPYFRDRAHMIIILPDEDAQISQVILKRTMRYISFRFSNVYLT